MVVKDERKRYILVSFMDEAPKRSYFNKILREKVGVLAGQLLLARSGISILDYKERMLIIKCNHKSREMVEAALPMLKINTAMKIITVSGTIKSIDKNLVDSENIGEEHL